MHASGGQRTTLDVVHSILRQIWLTRKPPKYACLCLSSAGIPSVPKTDVFIWLLWIKIRALFLYGEDFTSWAIFLAPKDLFSIEVSQSYIIITPGYAHRGIFPPPLLSIMDSTFCAMHTTLQGWKFYVCPAKEQEPLDKLDKKIRLM